MRIVKPGSEIATGTDPITNEKIGIVGQVLGVFGFLGPVASAVSGVGGGIGKATNIAAKLVDKTEVITENAGDVGRMAKSSTDVGARVVSRHDGPRNFLKNNPQYAGTHEIHHSREWNVLNRYPGTYTPSELNMEELMRPILKGQLFNGKPLHRSHIRKSWDGFQDLFRDRFNSGQISVDTMRTLVERHASYIDRIFLGYE